MKTQCILRSAKQMSVVVLSTLFLLSCKKEEEKVITTDDAADVVEYALISSSGGTADQAKDYAEEADVQLTALPCGGVFDTAVSVNYGGTVTGAYALQRHYVLSCDANAVETSLGCTGTYSGNFDAPRMSSSNLGSINWTLTGLDAASSAYIFNGSVDRSGSHTSKVRNKYTFNTSMVITSSDVQVDKTTGKIIAGSGTVTLNCDVEDGGSYDFTGSIVYHANETATLTINGSTYTITLY